MHPLTTVTAVRPQADRTWLIDTVRTGKRWRRTIRANQVVLAAGTWRIQQLLTRTNSEAIVGASRDTVDPLRDFSRGVAITSLLPPDEHTHIEPVRYGRGSNAMGLLQTLATDGALDTSRWRQLLRFVAQHPAQTVRLLSVRRWSERTVILLVMQS